MLHPSYSDLMNVVNADCEEGETPIVNSRYSIVLATAKRARQLIDGSEPLVSIRDRKPLSIAVEELYDGELKILNSSED
ncbi:MAG: DNA-directed RNA polymerase subunit omega [Lachnospiraceae bacterium]|nr:DNA-directed RNA polymerase subunit omega [Lachnospiraceae bacterium]